MKQQNSWSHASCIRSTILIINDDFIEDITSLIALLSLKTENILIFFALIVDMLQMLMLFDRVHVRLSAQILEMLQMMLMLMMTLTMMQPLQQQHKSQVYCCCLSCISVPLILVQWKSMVFNYVCSLVFTALYGTRKRYLDLSGQILATIRDKYFG